MEEDRSEFGEGFESEMFIERRSALVALDYGQLDMRRTRGEGLTNDRIHSALRESLPTGRRPGVDALDQPAFRSPYVRVGNEDDRAAIGNDPGPRKSALDPTSKPRGVPLRRIRAIFLQRLARAA